MFQKRISNIWEVVSEVPNNIIYLLGCTPHLFLLDKIEAIVILDRIERRRMKKRRGQMANTAGHIFGENVNEHCPRLLTLNERGM